MNLVTFFSLQDYFRNPQLANEYKTLGVKVYISLFQNISILRLIFINLLRFNRIVIHFKQTNPGRLFYIKNLFLNKICFITDLEGDHISEREFLIAKNALVSNNHNNEPNILISEQKNLLEKFDKIFVQTDYFKEILEKRHPHIKGRIIVAHLMSFKRDSLYFNRKIRIEYRSKLKWFSNPIIAYIGNIYYPWQNISKTIKLFKRIKFESHKDAKLLLLINKSDHNLAKRFMVDNEISEKDYYLEEVDNKEIVGYLNAADIGIILRDWHPMNLCATSGKILDYLGCGLPVISTTALGKISNEIKSRNYGLILNTTEIDCIPLEKIDHLLSLNYNKRFEISKWANAQLSLDSMASEYISYIRTVFK